MVYNIIVNDIIPIFVIMLLGYMGAKMHSFSPDQTQALNKVVLDIALPAALFASITRASRELLFSDLTLTIVSCWRCCPVHDQLFPVLETLET